MKLRNCKLGDVLKLQRGHDLPERLRKEGEVPVVTSSGITGFHNEAKAKAPGVVTGRYGTLGEVFYLDQDYWPHNTSLYVVDFKGTNPRFAAYYLRHVLRNYQSDKAAVPGIDRNVLHALDVRVPFGPVQEPIANVLSAYDDAIENNRRRMGLLEKAARLLYEEWFVRLRFPGHEHTPITNGLPQGWARKELGDVAASFEDGDWIESKDQGGEDYRLLQISNIGINEFVETGNFRFVSEDTFRRLNCRELSPGDLLISRMPTPIGRAWLVTSMPWKMITAVDAAILRVNDEVADTYFVLYHLNSKGSIGYCEQHAGGATRPRITRKELARQPLVLPNLRVQAHFRDVVKPINDLRTKLYQANNALRAARDLLLPRLMSGEIEV